jgi:hypothetical protein
MIILTYPYATLIRDLKRVKRVEALWLERMPRLVDRPGRVHRGSFPSRANQSAAATRYQRAGVSNESRLISCADCCLLACIIMLDSSSASLQ